MWTGFQDFDGVQPKESIFHVPLTIFRRTKQNVGMLACYDQAKESVAALLGDPMTNGPTLPTRLGASATAGFTAALFSLPFDLIKSRLMAQKPDPLTGVYPYKGVRTSIPMLC